MLQDSLRDIIYLSSRQSLPPYLASLRGVRWRWAQSPEKLKQILSTQVREVCVIVHLDFLSLRTVQAFMSWSRLKIKVSFVFIAQTIDNAVYTLRWTHARVLFLRESEMASMTDVLNRCLHGLDVRSRRQERKVVQSPVMLKKSVIMPASTGVVGSTAIASTGKPLPTKASHSSQIKGSAVAATSNPAGTGVANLEGNFTANITGGIQFLREGAMKDFSQGGAQIEIAEEGVVRAKDFVSVMYKDQRGTWVSVESQVRWVASTLAGRQIVGVQFLAVST